MKESFKPLALVAAVAALTAGTANAQQAGSFSSLGDFAIVPYYTVMDDWVTGIHITNTSDRTQVVKFRMRGAAESEDILDFNLVLSPYDMWTGTIRGNDEAIEVFTADKSCTVPIFNNGGTTAPVAPSLVAQGQEGYVEIIGMGSADVNDPIGIGSKHLAGVPLDCNAVRTNFIDSNLIANDETIQQGDSLLGLAGTNTYGETDDVLKVSYFIRDAASGIEFGNNSVQISEFSSDPMMTHQQYGIESYANKGDDALNGFDFPDVRGGGLNMGTASDRALFQDVIRPALGSTQIVNDWSYNATTGAATDWVITFPGQYAMINYWQRDAVNGILPATWDFRELPVEATFTLFDREETESVPGGLVFSPSPAADTAELPYEVNVITWGDTAPVLGSAYDLPVNPSDAGITAATGWASLSVTAPATRVTQVCDSAAGPVAPLADLCTSVGGPVPMVGFAAWDRTFDDPDKNYGRIVEHSFTTS